MTSLTSGTPAELYFPLGLLKSFILSYPHAKKERERGSRMTRWARVENEIFLEQMHEMCYYQRVKGLVCHIWLDL